MKNFGKLSFFLISILLLLVSCGYSPKFIVKDYSKPENISILPAINNSTDVEGGIVFRNLIFKKFENDKKEYHIQSKDITDSLLNEAGITDGGQLGSINNNELTKILKVDGLFYIEIIEMDYETLGISSSRKVKSNFKLYKRNTLYWEDEREVDNGKSAFGTLFSAAIDPVGTLKESGKDLGKQLIVKGLKSWLLDHELKPEMEQVINTSFYTLPK